MKTRHLLYQLGPVILLATHVIGQGTFIYDQQSSSEIQVFPGGAAINDAADPTQSFTPSLSAVGFIRLYIEDTDFQDGLGATLSVNLRSDSVNGTIIGSTTPVALPNGSPGTVNFFFASPISVVPQNTYYFEVVRLAGSDTWNVNNQVYNYSGGTLFVQGVPDTINNSDLWFREGLYVVPEPTSSCLFGISISAFLMHRARNRKK